MVESDLNNMSVISYIAKMFLGNYDKALRSILHYLLLTRGHHIEDLTQDSCYTLRAPSNYLNQYFESINDFTRYGFIYSRAIFAWILNVSIPEVSYNFKDLKPWPYLSGRTEMRVFYGSSSMGRTQITIIIMVTSWARWRPKSPASRQFAQTFIQTQIKGNIKAPCHWRFVRGIHRSPVNSPHKAPITRKKFPFDDVIMKSKGNINAWHCRYVECLIMSLCASMPSLPELQNDSECIANELK